MVVLLIGGSGVLTNAMIDKFNKNGPREGHPSYRRVFEKYNFTYDRGSIREILESIKPDITVFVSAL